MMPLVSPGTLRLALATLCAAAACSGVDAAGRDPSARLPAADRHLFTALPAAYTGVRFENRLTETADFNVFTYRNYYKGTYGVLFVMPTAKIRQLLGVDREVVVIATTWAVVSATI